MRYFGSVFVILSLLVSIPAVFGQAAPPPANLLGSWSLTTQAFLPGQESACNFSGIATITEQMGDTFSGTASMNLVNGPEGCPAELSATVNGTVVGNQITMAMLMGGDLGTGSFTGTVLDPLQQKETAKLDKAVIQQRTIQGSFSIGSGPFAGVSGTFGSAFQGFLESVPTLGGLGLLLLALLLALVGWAALKRTKTKAA